MERKIFKGSKRDLFDIAGCPGKFDVIATVTGGGFTGQAGALRHGISRALCQADRDAYRAPLEGCRILDKRLQNEGKKEVRIKESKKSFTVLQALIETVFQNNLTNFKRFKTLAIAGVFVL